MFLDTSSSFVQQARSAYELSLGNLLWGQAVFYAERLAAESPGDESAYLLGLAHYHNREIGRASRHLRGNRIPEARYLQAKCLYQLERWDDAEDALTTPTSMSGNHNGFEWCAEVVNGAAGWLLLGQVKEKQTKKEHAIDCYARCLELCPFMWEAYARWSALVLASPSPSRGSSSSMAQKAFTDERFTHFSTVTAQAQQPPLTSNPRRAGDRGALLTPVPGIGAFSPTPNGAISHLQSSPQNVPMTPTTRPSQNAPPRNMSEHSKVLMYGNAPRKERRTSDHAHTLRSGGSGGGGYGPSAQTSHREVCPPSRRSVGTATPLAEVVGAGGGAGGTFGGDALGVVAGEVNDRGDLTLASLLCKLGTALHAVHNFECHHALQLLTTLPRRHYETGYVLDLVGQCYFEVADYKKAEQVYQHVWRLEPKRVQGLEYYSSTLWHLRKDVELGHLAQQCLQWDRTKPQVWCVVGTCFSRQHEHDVAIKFYRRAIQVDPCFTYAYTLCAHELVANEKFDKATPMYEHALSIDSRHYNAWWGLGNIYHRQEEFENARYHFLRALEINPNNSVLRCYLGMVLDSLNNPIMALESFELATKAEPHNGMAFFQKACVLMSLERYQEALADLTKVHALAPKEACVSFQLGKVYMKLQQGKKALLHFNVAMDLSRDSKEYHTIKTHIEQLNLQFVRPDIEDEHGLERAQVEGLSHPSVGTAAVAVTTATSAANSGRQSFSTSGASAGGATASGGGQPLVSVVSARVAGPSVATPATPPVYQWNMFDRGGAIDPQPELPTNPSGHSQITSGRVTAGGAAGARSSRWAASRSLTGGAGAVPPHPGGGCPSTSSAGTGYRT